MTLGLEKQERILLALDIIQLTPILLQTKQNLKVVCGQFQFFEEALFQNLEKIYFFYAIKKKNGAVIKIPPPITKINEGSQL